MQRWFISVVLSGLLQFGCGGEDSDTDTPDANTPTQHPIISPTPADDSPRETPTPAGESPEPSETPAMAPSLVLSSRAVDLGTVTLGDGNDVTITISNEGTAALSLALDIQTVTGGNFILTTAADQIPASLAPDTSTEIEITFEPKAEGTSTGILTIQSNDPLEPVVTVSLTGSGVKKDSDQDGWSVDEGDCDDNDSSKNPGIDEVCDDIDNNCNGAIDEGVLNTYYHDQDSDGFGTSDQIQTACISYGDLVLLSGDCDDSNSDVFPTNVESCDQIDNNCNATIDESLPVSIYYQDSDGDGHGDPDVTLENCGEIAGTAAIGDDCDDQAAGTYPGAEEPCDGVDNDCDDLVDEEGASTFYADSDGDGHGDADLAEVTCDPADYQVPTSDDCDDTDPSISPSATEVCDTIDNDCDALVDEEVTHRYYRDEDGDGFGSATSILACQLPSGYVTNDDDCNDANASSYPGAQEICDLVDNDCDAQVDEGVLLTYYLDADADEYGVSSSTTKGCSPPDGYAVIGGDCNDSDATVYPQATETCDQKDNDCDGSIDEGVATSYYEDQDADGYGNPATVKNSCIAIEGYVTRSGDCDDAMSTVNPSGKEVCNGLDDDCSGTTDSDFDSTVTEIDNYNLTCGAYDSVSGAEIPGLLVVYKGDVVLDYSDGILVGGHHNNARPGTDYGWPSGCRYYDDGYYWGIEASVGSTVYPVELCFSKGTDSTSGDELYLRIYYGSVVIKGAFNNDADDDSSELDQVAFADDESSETVEIWYISDAGAIVGQGVDASLELHDARAVLTYVE